MDLHINVLVKHFFRLLITNQQIALITPPIYNEDAILNV